MACSPRENIAPVSSKPRPLDMIPKAPTIKQMVSSNSHLVKRNKQGWQASVDERPAANTVQRKNIGSHTAEGFKKDIKIRNIETFQGKWTTSRPETPNGVTYPEGLGLVIHSETLRQVSKPEQNKLQRKTLQTEPRLASLDSRLWQPVAKTVQAATIFLDNPVESVELPASISPKNPREKPQASAKATANLFNSDIKGWQINSNDYIDDFTLSDSTTFN